MKRLLLFPVMFLLLQCAYAQSKEEKAVAAAVENMRLAMISGNKADLEKLADDKLSYGHSSGALEDKPTFVEHIVSGRSDFVNIKLSGQTITVVGNTAIVRHVLDADTNDSGKPGTVHLRIILVFVKEGGQWKLLARQAMH